MTFKDQQNENSIYLFPFRIFVASKTCIQAKWKQEKSILFIHSKNLIVQKTRNTVDYFYESKEMPQKKCNFVAKIRTMGANSSYKAMYNIVEQAKDGTIFMFS